MRPISKKAKSRLICKTGNYSNRDICTIYLEPSFSCRSYSHLMTEDNMKSNQVKALRLVYQKSVQFLTTKLPKIPCLIYLAIKIN